MSHGPCDGCSGCAADLGPAAEQPFGEEFSTVDGVFIKQMVIPRAGTVVPQHSHAYDHASLLAVGAVRYWADGDYKGTRNAPAMLSIPAGVKHRFESVVDNVVIYCIHNVARAGKVEVREENHIVEA